MITKYGELPQHQIASAKKHLQSIIFYLLLYVDPKTSIEFPGVDVNEAFDNVLHQLIGFNKILLEPKELPIVMGKLEAARVVYNGPEFDFSTYRKLILDAGIEIMEVKEGDASGDYL